MRKSFVLKIHAADVVGIARAKARELGCDPKQLCVALLTLVLRQDMVGGILDGDDPRDVYPDFRSDLGRRALGPAQLSMLAFLRDHADESGTTQLSLRAIALARGVGTGEICRQLGTLKKRGAIEQVSRGGRNTPSRWRVVEERGE